MHLGWVRTNRADVIAWKRLGYAARASGPLTLYSSLLLFFVPHVSELGVRELILGDSQRRPAHLSAPKSTE